jgi:hypothetical protein
VSAVAPRALGLLARLLEAPIGRAAQAWLEDDDQPALKALADAGAMKSCSDVVPVMCPACERHEVAPQTAGKVLRALCPECGYVPIENDSIQITVPNVDWLLMRMRQALGMDARQDSQALVENILWKIGDRPEGKTRRRRFLFARRLTDAATHKPILTALGDRVERDNGIIVGTAPAQHYPFSHLSLTYVHLAELFRWRAGKFELDDGLLAWCLKPAHLRSHLRSAIFDEAFRTAIIDGEEFHFSATQAEFWELMHGLGGAKAHKTTLMANTESKQESPRELFRHNAEQMRAYERLVEFDAEGFYRLRPA